MQPHTIPDVSVIIVNYNAGNKLLACLKSVFSAELEIEVIVVDNNSHDESLQLLGEAFSSDSRLKIIHNQKNMGFAFGCNQGSSIASGNYFLYLNPDTRVEPETIPRLLNCFEKHHDAGMVGGLILNDDGSEQRGCRRAIPTPWTSLVNTFGLHRLAWIHASLFKDFRRDNEQLPDSDITVEAISGACMCVPREVFLDVGPMDEGYFLHCEDLDWCMQFRNKGYDILFTPFARLHHSKGSCSSTVPVMVEWEKHKGMVRFYKKFFKQRYPTVMMWVVFGGIWMRFGLSMVRHYWNTIFRPVTDGA